MYKKIKEDVLGCTILFLSILGTILVSGFSDYSGFTENEAWLCLSIIAGTMFLLSSLGTIFAYYLAEKINKYQTRKFMILVVRKFLAFDEKIFG